LLKGAVTDRLNQRKQLTETEKENWQPCDLLDLLLPFGESENSSEGLHPDELLPNLWVFFIAGHDTTATSLMWTIRFSSHSFLQ
jgi:cytochrome P450